MFKRNRSMRKSACNKKRTSSFRRGLVFESLESRLALSTTPIATILGQEVPLPSYLTAEEIATAQLLASQITTGNSTLFADAFDAQSFPVVRSPQYVGNSGFSGFNGSGVSVVVIDTGADLDNPLFGPDLNFDGIGDRIIQQFDYSGANDNNANDFSGHGSNVAGIIAEMAPGVNLIIHKVFPDAGGGASFNDVQESLQWVAANYAAFNIVAVNMSLGTGNFQNTTVPIGDVISDELAFLDSVRVSVVTAAGNSFYENNSVPGIAYPASLDSTISVGATYDAPVGQVQYVSGAIDYTTDTDRIASFSQRHATMLDILAPGAFITSAGLNGTTSYSLAGTSQAAPHITAAASMLQDMSLTQTGTRLTHTALLASLQNTGVAVNDGDNENDNVTNTGLTFRRLDMLGAAYDIYTPASPLLAVSSNSGSTADTITNDNTPTITGTVPASSFVRLYVDGTERGSQQLSGGATQFLITPSITLADGNHSVTIRVAENSTVPLANMSNVSGSLSITIDTMGPRVNNVLVKGSNWTRAPYSYASIVPMGKQLAPIYTEGVNSIQLAFNESVTLTQSALVLVGTGARHGNTTATVAYAGFDPGTLAWTFSPLAADKYRIDLAATGVTDAAGNLLDGEWANLKGSDIDVFTDDPSGRTLLSGDATAGGAFQFLFSYLPGDYNQNGLVEPTDLNTVADGNGDGVVNSSDGAAFLTPRYGNVLSLRREGGDYSNDEYVNLADYALWRATYGSTVNLAADGNGNGAVDAADYTLFRYWEYTQGSWYQGLSGFGAMLPVVDFGNAPNVANVTISGSTSAHNPYSFDGHDGSGEQLRTVPVGAADTISITFSEDVNVTAENLRVSGLRTAYTPTLAQFSYDMASMTATWRFSGLPPIDHYIISLSDAVTDIEGNRLDGEWINPMSITTVNSLVSDFPSGNGNAGGNFNFVFTLLTGDANLDLQVTYADYSIWSAHYYQNGGFTIGDFDGSGQVNSADIVAWYSNYGKDLRNVQMLSDLNGDYTVNDADLNILATNLGMSNPTHNDGDLNGDGQINTSDLDLMFAQYGVQLSLAS
jgi:hypothetical protein